MNIYDGKKITSPTKDGPVLVHLTKKDRENIANMPDDAVGIYACLDDSYSDKEKERFIKGYEDEWRRQCNSEKE